MYYVTYIFKTIVLLLDAKFRGCNSDITSNREIPTREIPIFQKFFYGSLSLVWETLEQKCCAKVV